MVGELLGDGSKSLAICIQAEDTFHDQSRFGVTLEPV